MVSWPSNACIFNEYGSHFFPNETVIFQHNLITSMVKSTFCYTYCSVAGAIIPINILLKSLHLYICERCTSYRTDNHFAELL